jgi:hypothetical protein
MKQKAVLVRAPSARSGRNSGTRTVQTHQNHAQNGAVPVPLLLAFVTFADDELQVLEQHLSECPNRLGVLVDVGVTNRISSWSITSSIDNRSS